MDSVFRQFHITPNPGSSHITRAIRYIEQNYARPITLNEVANLVYLNPEYFSRHFKKETGTNFNNYVNTVRLKQALELVSHTDKKLSEIAELCGFQSFSYFSKRFKEMFGCSPYALRSARGEDMQ